MISEKATNLKLTKKGSSQYYLQTGIMTKKPDPDQLNLWDPLNNDQWMNFKEAREIAQSLNLNSADEWREVFDTTNKLDPEIIPKNPDHAYRFQGWMSWNDWLGLT